MPTKTVSTKVTLHVCQGGGERLASQQEALKFLSKYDIGFVQNYMSLPIHDEYSPNRRVVLTPEGKARIERLADFSYGNPRLGNIVIRDFTEIPKTGLLLQS